MITSSEKQPNEIEPNNDMELLINFIELIKGKFQPTDNYEMHKTLALTTEELAQKIHLASGKNYDSHLINQRMTDSGFSMVFITVDHNTNYYWLLNPII